MGEYSAYTLSFKILKDFVKTEKVVTESAKACLPSVVRFIVGHDYRGSWWALPKSSLIYNALVQLRSWERILVCRLIKGKITFVYKDAWPFLISLADELPKEALSRVQEVHSEKGTHYIEVTELERWAPVDLLNKSHELSRKEAFNGLYDLLPRPDELFKDIRISG